MSTARAIRIKNLPIGVPIPNRDFVIETVSLPPLQNNELLIEAQWISVDPYLRSRIAGWGVNQIMQSYQIAKVIESKNEKYKAGDYIYGHLDWQTKGIIKDDRVISKVDPKDLEKISLSHFVGSYGMPGRTAWYGLLNIGKLRHGENVLVSGAAGAVGSYVGQIAKLYSCYTVGICGSQDKVNWITNELGFDHGINYKEFNEDSTKLTARLSTLFPDGIDLYFDNTGGFITESVWDILADRARVIVCGQIAVYNKGINLHGDQEAGNFDQLKTNEFMFKTIYRQISILGFVVTNFKDSSIFDKTMKQWIIDGKIKARETVVEGFDNIPKAFVGLFSGKNFGKMVIKCKL